MCSKNTHPFIEIPVDEIIKSGKIVVVSGPLFTHANTWLVKYNSITVTFGENLING